MIRQQTDHPTLEGPRAASARRGTLWLFREQLTRAGEPLATVLDPDTIASEVGADTAYRSKDDLARLVRRRRVERLRRPKPRGEPIASNVRRGNAERAEVRAAIEPVFAVPERRLGLVLHNVGKPRAETKRGRANLVTDVRRFASADPKVHQ